MKHKTEKKNKEKRRMELEKSEPQHEYTINDTDKEVHEDTLHLNQHTTGTSVLIVKKKHCFVLSFGEINCLKPRWFLKIGIKAVGFF